MIFNHEYGSGIEIRIKNKRLRIGKYKRKQSKIFRYTHHSVRYYKLIFEISFLNLGIALLENIYD
jgi:hypothetical protein